MCILYFERMYCFCTVTRGIPYNGHLRGPVTLPPNAERLAAESLSHYQLLVLLLVPDLILLAFDRSRDNTEKKNYTSVEYWNDILLIYLLRCSYIVDMYYYQT